MKGMNSTIPAKRSRKTESLSLDEKKKLKALVRKHILTTGLYEKDIYLLLDISEPTYQKVKKTGIAAPAVIEKFRQLLTPQTA